MAFSNLPYHAVRSICSYSRVVNFRTLPAPNTSPSHTLFTRFLHRKAFHVRTSTVSLGSGQRVVAYSPIWLSCCSLRGYSLWNTNVKIYDAYHCKHLSCKFFHTTPRQKAIPPIVLAVLRPVLNVAGVLLGRLFRKFWKRLPQSKRDKIILTLRKHKSKILGAMGVLSLGVLVYVLAHMEEVPQTKRRRFVLFSHQDMRFLSDEAQYEIIQTYKKSFLPGHHPSSRRVLKVMSQLMDANHDDIVKSGVTSWSIYVVEDPNVNNAMVLPNGSVFVFTGIINTCSNDDQLGTVLAHEVAHVLLNHQGEAFSTEHFYGLFSVLLITAIWAVLPDFAAFLSHVFAAQTSALFISLPFSRLMESEADTVGLDLAAKACFDVREASVFWGKMALFEELNREGEPLPFEVLLSTHPSSETRQNSIDALIPGVLKLRESCKCGALSSSDPRDAFSQFRNQLRRPSV